MAAPRRLIVVSHVLPVRLERIAESEWTAVWDEEIARPEVSISRYLAVGVRKLNCPVLFIGSPHCFVPRAERPAVEAALAAARINCVCAYTEPSIAHRFYQGYCKGSLWPIMHNVIDVYNHASAGAIGESSPRPPRRYGSDRSSDGAESDWHVPRSWSPVEGQEACWPDYCEVNRALAMKVVELFQEGDIIWIHHYHLMLVPSYLKRRLRSSTPIGFFMHQPFPSSEIFRTLSNREELLRGILCADHIGFHLFEWAKNFLACCRRLLACSFEGRRGGGLSVTYNGRQISITCAHMGVEPSLVEQQLPCASVALRLEQLSRQTEGMDVVASVDMLEGLKGVPLKLLAYEHFLLRYPHRARRTVLLLRGIIPDARPDDYRSCRAEVINLVRRINSAVPGAVQFEEANKLNLRERIALWSVASVLLATSARDGLNLMPIEFLLCRKSRPGVLLLSEFSSAARVLPSAVLANPWSIRKVAEGLELALSMYPEDVAKQIAPDLEWAQTNSASAWAGRVLGDVALANQIAQNTADETPGPAVGMGLGFAWRPGSVNGVESMSSCSPLHNQALLDAYRRTSRRLLIFAHSGVLTASDGASSRPSAAVIAALKVICCDPRNTVLITSSEAPDAVSEAFGLIPGCSLSAANGAEVAFAHGLDMPREWKRSSLAENEGWRELAFTVMSMYATRTNGATAEATAQGVLFNYAKADPEFGAMQARELHNHLSEVLQGYGVDLCLKPSTLLAKPAGVDKGVVVRAALAALCETGEGPDFVLALGDDESDEPMFEVLRKWRCPSQQSGIAVDDSFTRWVFTCATSNKPTRASFCIEDEQASSSLLESIKLGSLRASKSFSVQDAMSTMGVGRCEAMPTLLEPSSLSHGTHGSDCGRARKRTHSSDPLAPRLSAKAAAPPLVGSAGAPDAVAWTPLPATEGSFAPRRVAEDGDVLGSLRPSVPTPVPSVLAPPRKRTLSSGGCPYKQESGAPLRAAGGRRCAGGKGAEGGNGRSATSRLHLGEVGSSRRRVFTYSRCVKMASVALVCYWALRAGGRRQSGWRARARAMALLTALLALVAGFGRHAIQLLPELQPRTDRREGMARKVR